MSRVVPNDNIKIVQIFTNDKIIDCYVPFRSSFGKSQGSGIFISPTVILTCAHVIEDAENIHIVQSSNNNNKLKANVLCVCYDRDIALLTIKNEDAFIKNINLKKSYNIEQGIDVVVVGYPIGQHQIKYTKGIISGITDGLIQTDASVNSGNSGGGLFDTNGNLLGLVSSGIDSAEGIGFAIPIKNVDVVIDEMYIHMKKSAEKILHCPSILTKFQNVDDKLKSVFKINHNHGYMITKIHVNSPLYECGLRENDFVMEIDNKKIDNWGFIDKNMNILNYLNNINSNKLIDIKYIRPNSDRNIQSTNLKLVYKNINKIKYIRFPFEKYAYIYVNGMILMDLTKNHIDELSVGTENDVSMSIKNIYKIRSQKDEFNSMEGKVVVSFIGNESSEQITNNVKVGDFVVSVNGVSISSINDIIKFHNINNKYDNYVFKTDTNVIFCVMNNINSKK